MSWDDWDDQEEEDLADDEGNLRAGVAQSPEASTEVWSRPSARDERLPEGCASIIAIALLGLVLYSCHV